MVLRGLERHPDVHLKLLPPLGHEERRELIDLLMVLDDGREPLHCGLFPEGAEVLTQEVLRYEAGTEFVAEDRFQTHCHGVGELDDVLCQDLHLNELLHPAKRETLKKYVLDIKFYNINFNTRKMSK